MGSQSARTFALGRRRPPLGKGRLASQHASREDIERAALEAGMKMLWDDGLAKITSGLTSLEELARVVV